MAMLKKRRWEKSEEKLRVERKKRRKKRRLIFCRLGKRVVENLVVICLGWLELSWGKKRRHK